MHKKYQITLDSSQEIVSNACQKYSTCSSRGDPFNCAVSPTRKGLVSGNAHCPRRQPESLPTTTNQPAIC